MGERGWSDVLLALNKEWKACFAISPSAFPQDPSYAEDLNKLKEIQDLLRSVEESFDVSGAAAGHIALINAFNRSVRSFASVVNKAKPSFDKHEYGQTLSQINVYYQRFSEGWLSPGGSNIDNLGPVAAAIIAINRSFIPDEIKVKISALDDLEKKLKDSIEVVRDKSNRKILQSYADKFDTFATGKSKTARWWLLAAIGILVLMLAGSLFKFYVWDAGFIALPDSEDRVVVIILYYLGRFVIISLLLYIVVYCLRQYRINKNIEQTYRHRAISLDSFLLFENALPITSSEAKTAVIHEVARMIYSHHPTGYEFKDAKLAPLSFKDLVPTTVMPGVVKDGA